VSEAADKLRAFFQRLHAAAVDNGTQREVMSKSDFLGRIETVLGERDDLFKALQSIHEANNAPWPPSTWVSPTHEVKNDGTGRVICSKYGLGYGTCVCCSNDQEAAEKERYDQHRAAIRVAIEATAKLLRKLTACETCNGSKLVPNQTVPRLDDPEWWPCPSCTKEGAPAP
jgi:hypothetical protein